MEQSLPNSHQLRAYLLGLEPVSQPGTPPNPQLEQPGNDALEDKIFTDDAVYRALEQEREALIDDFVSGLLTPQEENILKEQCRLSASLRERVAERHNLVAALQRQRSRPNRSALRWPRPSVWIPSASALAACLLVGIVLLHHRAAQTPSKQAVHPAAESSSNIPAEPRTTPTAGSKVFFLADLVTRGTSKTPVLMLPPTSPAIDLQIELKDAPSGSRWEMDLLRGKTSVWNATGTTERVGGLSILTAHLDASTLQRGDFTLVARSTEGEKRVVRRGFVVERSP
jgi:hypothetical protein